MSAPSSSNQPSTIVTGGAGFIGSHLVERLIRDGKRVIVIDDLSTGSLENLQSVAGHERLQVITSKVSAFTGLTELMSRCEAVYHLAAAVGVELVLRSPLQSMQTNLHETEAILEAASRYRVPVLLTSSSEVYGKSKKEAFSEDDELIIGPPHITRWSYACSKLMDEFLALGYAKERGLPVIITRIFNTVGPRQSGRYGMVLPRFMAAARAGQPLRVYGDGTQKRCFCYVEDTVETLVRLQASPMARGEIVNVGSDVETSISGLARWVIRRLSSFSRIEFVPYNEAYHPGFEDFPRRRPRLDKLHRLVGQIAPTPLDAAIGAGWLTGPLGESTPKRKNAASSIEAAFAKPD